MNMREPVSKIMTSQVKTVDIHQSLEDAERLMTQNNIRHIPVVRNGELAGMLSLNDLLRISFADNIRDGESSVDTAIFEMLSIEEVMKEHPVSVTADTTIRVVAEIFIEREFHALPVTQDEKLVGIVTTTDLIKYFVKAN